MNKWFRTALCLALTCMLASPALAEAKEVFRFGHSGNATDDFSFGAEQFAASLAKISNGQAEVKVMGNAVIGNDRVTTEMCQQGSLDFSLIALSQSNLFVKTMSVFDLPYIVKPEFTNAFLEASLPGNKMHEYLDALFQKVGLKLISIMATPPRSYAFSPKARVTSLDSVKGVKVRITLSPVERAFVNALGMNPSSMAWPEVYTAVQQGTVDGEIINPATVVSGSRLEVEDTFLLTEHNAAKMLFLMSKARWDKLSPEMRKWIMDAGIESSRLEWRKSEELNKAAIETCKARGMKFVELSAADKEKMMQLIAPIYEEFKNDHDPELIKIVQEIQK